MPSVPPAFIDRAAAIAGGDATEDEKIQQLAALFYDAACVQRHAAAGRVVAGYDQLADYPGGARLRQTFEVLAGQFLGWPSPQRRGMLAQMLDAVHTHPVAPVPAVAVMASKEP